MAWSAGQKEFMPLLLGIYCLSGPPTQVVNREDYEWVIIEEPEMGLHPQAIQSVLLEIIELIKTDIRLSYQHTLPHFQSLYGLSTIFRIYRKKTLKQR